jgi:hypothetical protein
MRGDLGSVAVGERRRAPGRHGKVDPGHALKQLGDLIALPLQLRGVGEILILTSAALTEDRAQGFDPVGTRAHDPDEIGFGETGAVPENAGDDPLTGEGLGNKNDPVLHSTDTFPEVR